MLMVAGAVVSAVALAAVGQWSAGIVVAVVGLVLAAATCRRGG
jgi:hypothetical protein